MELESKIKVVDPDTGEIVVEYVPGDPRYATDIAKAVRQLKKKMAEIAMMRQGLEKALVDVCPNGLKTPDVTVSVDINIGKEDAKQLVAHGYGSCISINESVKYRLLKKEVKKYELLPDKYDELMELLSGCSRSVRITDMPDEEDA